MSRGHASKKRTQGHVSIRIEASVQACLFLTPLMAELFGRGVFPREAGGGSWLLETWAPAERWTRRKEKRLADACRRLAAHFPDPVVPRLRWEAREGPPEPERRGERRFFRPFRATENLWVLPKGNVIPEEPGVACIRLDPGKAFGTGIHPATRCCLRLLRHVLDGWVPARALDVGTGTGILALAASKWGVGRILALDSNPHAVRIARKNIRHNAMTGRIKVRCRDVAREGGRYPLVMAHLPERTIAGRAGSITHCLENQGWLILGGIRREKLRGFCNRHFPGLEIHRVETEALWKAALMKKTTLRLRSHSGLTDRPLETT